MFLLYQFYIDSILVAFVSDVSTDYLTSASVDLWKEQSTVNSQNYITYLYGWWWYCETQIDFNAMIVDYSENWLSGWNSEILATRLCNLFHEMSERDWEQYLNRQ